MYVNINNGNSDFLHDLNIGVPQRSVLGPLLFFLLHINDQLTHISSNVSLLADDISLVVSYYYYFYYY